MADTLSRLWKKLEPYAGGYLKRIGILGQNGASAAGGAPSPHALNSSHHTGALSPSQFPDALLRDGSRSVLADLPVAAGVLVDGVDIDVFKTDYDAHELADAVTAHGAVGVHNHQSNPAGGLLDHNAALSNLTTGNPHTQYAGANGSGVTTSAYQAERLNQSTLAGNGLTGGGAHTGPVTLNVGAGAGIAVGADDISVDTTQIFSWGDEHQFNADVYMMAYLRTMNILPQSADLVDVGEPTLRYRKLFVSEIQAAVFAENTIFPIGGYFTICKDQGTLAAAASSGATTIDFGKAMTLNDFVVLRGHDTAGSLAFESIKIGSLVSGTTYNVSRNQDSSGANNWPEGSVWACWGGNGNGRIEIQAASTPRIQMITRTGTNWADELEMLRIGDLAGSWGVPAGETYGVAIGQYASAKPNMLITATELKLRNFSTDIITLDNTGAKIVGTMSVTGEIQAGGSAVKLNANGQQIDIAAVSETATNGIQLMSGATLWGGLFGFGNQLKLRKNPVSGAQSNIVISADAPTGQTASALMDATVNGVTQARVYVGNGGGSNPYKVALSGTKVEFSTSRIEWGNNQFPVGTPDDNDMHRRIDRDLIYYYDSTLGVWLTIHEYTITMPDQRIPDGTLNSTNITATTSGTEQTIWLWPLHGTYKTLITGMWFNITKGGTHDASNNFTVSLKAFDYAAAATTLTTWTTNNRAARFEEVYGTVLNTDGTSGASPNRVALRVFKTGAPGTLNMGLLLKFRLVG